MAEHLCRAPICSFTLTFAVLCGIRPTALRELDPIIPVLDPFKGPIFKLKAIAAFLRVRWRSTPDSGEFKKISSCDYYEKCKYRIIFACFFQKIKNHAFNFPRFGRKNTIGLWNFNKVEIFLLHLFLWKALKNSSPWFEPQAPTHCLCHCKYSTD